VPANWRLSSACLPGREHRALEPLEMRLTRVADEMAEAIVATLPRERPLLLIGHSLGAVIAFEVALRLSPLALAAFACPPPHQIPDGQAPDLSWDPDLFWDEVITRVSGGQDLSPDLVAEIRDMNRPIVEADMAMLETYVWDGRRTRCDIWAVYGSADYVLPGSWAEQTSGTAQTVILPGGHYLPCDNPKRAVGELVHRVDMSAAANRPGGDRLLP
jgi:surfactin synthase thioesterase subunit